jgi:hypothetical protein
VSDAKATAPPPAPTPEEAFEIVVNGQKQTRTKEELLKAAQLEAFAKRSIDDSRKAYKALEKRNAEMNAALNSAMQGDPSALHRLLGTTPAEVARDPAKQAAIMKLLGVDPDAHARTLLSQKLDMANMTPEQRRIAELEAKVAEAQKVAEQASAARRQERLALRAKQQQARLFKGLTEAAERAGLPADESSLAVIHKVMEDLHANDVPMTPELIVELAKERMDETFKYLESQTLKGLKGPSLVQRLGPEVMKEIRSHLISEKEFIREVRLALAAKLRAGKPLEAPTQQSSQQPAQSQAGAPKYISQSELDATVKQLASRHR